jgi:hypothetical protein
MRGVLESHGVELALGETMARFEGPEGGRRTWTSPAG